MERKTILQSRCQLFQEIMVKLMKRQDTENLEAAAFQEDSPRDALLNLSHTISVNIHSNQAETERI